jgi:hypothetical protein
MTEIPSTGADAPGGAVGPASIPPVAVLCAGIEKKVPDPSRKTTVGPKVVTFGPTGVVANGYVG